MPASTLRGSAASPGLAIGRALRVDDVRPGAEAPVADRAAEAVRAATALASAGSELEATAGRLRAAGHGAEAEIVEAGALMALDPTLAAAVEAAVRQGGRSAAVAITEAAAEHADAIAAIPDERLAARADDVRALSRRAARLASGGGAAPRAPDGVVLIARDLGPADVAELDGVAAITLSAGGATAHAAIVARSLGIPMVVGAGAALLALPDGIDLVVDGERGTIDAPPDPDRAREARDAMEARARRARRARADGKRPAITRDGQVMRVLGNATGAPEVRAALAAGAEGIGLLRTELAFLDAAAWPTEAEHRRALDAVAATLGPGLLTVRLLDFGGDKTPPFLAGTPERGIALLLGAPDALAAQLAAVAALTKRVELRVLVPLVEDVEQLEAVRRALPAGTAVGAMIETPAAAAAAGELARLGAFLSIGTNDLTSATLGTDRFGGGAAPAHHPRVLAEIARTARAARAAGVTLEVCGESASDPIALPLLVGLGVDEVSVGAARVGAVRGWIRALDGGEAAALADAALVLADEQAVAALVGQRLGGRLGEAAEEDGEPVNGVRGVGAVGA